MMSTVPDLLVEAQPEGANVEIVRGVWTLSDGVFDDLSRRELPPLVSLFVYALAFSLTCTRIPAALGALLLFGAVQVTMVGRGIVAGERPGASEWAGLLLSLGGLVALTLPGLRQGDATGSMLMIGAGIAWGVYMLLGRSSRSDPLAATATHFAYAALRGLSKTRPALVQLSVPPLAALGGVLLIGEDVTLRLVLSAAAILGGIALAVTSRRA